MSQMQQVSNIPENRVLPKKFKEIYLTIQKFYDKKDYVNGLKATEHILEKYPNHGETLALKGLMIHAKGDREEGHKLVKQGIKNDVVSNVCWHVLGLLHRSENNLKEASKCYLNALRWDPHNQAILRDLSWLQIQVRDFPGFSESRRKILVLRPNLRVNWIAYIAATYFNGNYATASDLVEKYKAAWPPEPSALYEDSELQLFQTRCLERQGKYAEAMTQLRVCEGTIVDKFFIHTKHAELLVLLGQFEEGRQEWLDILVEHTDNYRFHAGYQAAVLELDQITSIRSFAMKRLELPSNVLVLTVSQREMLLNAYRTLVPRSKATDKILLELLEGDEFITELDTYMRKRISEGVPSLYQDLRSFARIIDPVNTSTRIFATDPLDLRTHPVITSAFILCDQYIHNYQTFGSIHGIDKDSDSPTSLLWSWYLKCSLLEMTGQYTEALEVIELCISHTPSAPDMIAKKAKILKKCGDYAGAAVFMDACRRLDLQDRYLNNKATKYLLRADMMQSAMDTIALFTKHDGDPQQTLYELQCNWYENVAGECYARTGDLGQALKKFLATEKHFFDYAEDMFDFHQFCLRKATLRSYEDVLVMLDGLFQHKYFQRAARGAVSVYMQLHEGPKPKEPSVVLTEEMAGLSVAEQKKIREKLKKQAKKKEKKEKAKGDADDAGDEERDGESKDEEAIRQILAKNPLEEASRMCAELVKFPEADASSQALAFRVYMARNKTSLALRCVMCGLARHPLHPELVVCLVTFVRRWQQNKIEMSDVAREVALETLPILASVQALEAYVADFVDTSKTLSLPHRVAAAKCLMLLSSKAASVAQASQLILDSWEGRGITLENVLAAYNALQHEVNASKSVADEYKSISLQRFPLANAFGGGSKVTLDMDVPFLEQEFVLGSGGEHS